MNSGSSALPAAGTDGRTARWERHRAERRADLVRTARRAIHRIGPGASMEEVAAAAGTSKSVFYRYFGDKDGLRRAVGEVVVARMRSRVLAAADEAATEREALRAMVGTYLDLAESSPHVYFFVTAPGGSHGGAEEHIDAFFAELATMIGERMAAYRASTGVPGAGDPGPGALRGATALWPTAAIGMVRAAGEAWLRQPDAPGRPTQAELAHELTAWLVRGIATGPSDQGKARQ